MGLFSGKKNKEDKNIKCSACGITMKQLRFQESEWQRRLNAMNAGLSLGSPVPSMLKCPKCGAYSCSKCAPDGPEMKQCPACGADYDFDSFVK
jgi:transcription elongation factor Elf1